MIIMIRTVVSTELYKIFSKKLFLLLFFVLLLLNNFFLYNSQIKGSDIEFASAIAKINLDNDIRKISSNGQRIKFIDNKLDSVYEEDAILYTGDSYSDRKLLENTKTQLGIVSDYQSYIQNVIDAAENITYVSIFADEDSFSYKNATVTAADYSTLYNVNTSYDRSYGINMATDFLLTDLMVFFLLLIVCDSLIGSERSIKITGLQKTFKYGRERLALAKLIAAFIATTIICISFYGMNYIVSGGLYDFGDISRSIQSVEGFANCILKINVFQFLMLFLVFKLLVMFLICLIISVVSMISKSKMGTYVIVMGLFLSSYILYSTIDDNTSIMWLKYINLISFIDVRSLFTHYININLFGNPVNYFVVFCLFVFALLFAFAALNILIYKYKKISGYNKYTNGALTKIHLFNRGTNVIYHEMYKAFVSNKVGLLFLMLIVFQIIVTVAFPLTLNEDEKYEKYYFSNYAGEFSDEKRDNIQAEIEMFEKDKEEYAVLTDNYEKGLISDDEYMRLSAKHIETVEEYQKFNKYVEPYNEFLCSQIDSGKEVSVMFYRGYNIILGISGDLSNIYCLVLYGLIIICVVPVFTREYERKTIPLLCSTKIGFKRLIGKKLICTIIITLALNVLVYVPYFLRIFKCYGLDGLDSPSCSIPAFGNLSSHISVLQIVILAFTVRLFVSIVISIIITVVSVSTRSTIASVIISAIFFVVPVLLPLNNINILNEFSLYYLQNFGGVFSAL